MEPTSYEQLRPGCYDVHERIRDTVSYTHLTLPTSDLV